MIRTLLILLFFLAGMATASGQEVAPQAFSSAQAKVAAGQVVTVSWYPGALKGFSQKETAQIIIEAMQQWQGISGVRFGTLPPGYKTDITIYPYTAARPPWAMATWPDTGQVLYTTVKKFDRDWVRMAFAHEFAHCFGWGHSPKDRDESLMHPNGSSVRYFDHNDARRAWANYGKYRGQHWPYSLRYVGDKIREHKADLAKWQELFDRKNDQWNKANDAFEKYRDLRDKATDPERRAFYETKRADAYERREHAGEGRKLANDRIRTVNRKLTDRSVQWRRIKRQWESVDGIRVYSQQVEPMADGGPMSCFPIEGPQAMQAKSLRTIFEELGELQTVPVEVN